MMKRRYVLKGLSIVAGGRVVRGDFLPVLAMGTDVAATAPPLAVEIGGLVRKGGKLMQPLQIYVQHAGAEAAVVTTLDGVEVDLRTLPAGSRRSTC